MPLASRWELPIEVCSLQTFLFGSPTAPLPQMVAFYDAERPSTHFLTFDALRLWSLRLAAGLQKAGLQPGDRVLLFSGNNLLYPAAFLGVLMAGGVFTGANPGSVARELAYQLKNSDSRFLFCADESLEMGLEAAESIGMGKERVFLFDDLLLDGTGTSRLGVKNWSTLFEPESVGRRFQWYQLEDPKEAICALNYSSGTTGVPKGVMVTHFNYIANAIQFANHAEVDPAEPEKKKTEKWLCFLPFYHAMAQTIFTAVALKRQIPVYIMKKFDFVAMLEAIPKYKITSLMMVPPIVVALVKSPITRNYDLSSVVDISCGAAPLSGDVIEEVEALWGQDGPKLRQGWGMTEATCAVTGWDAITAPVPSSVGELNANCSAKIMTEDGTAELPVGQRGELWVQGPNVMKGYWRNERATREVIIEGPDGRWMKTGDVAYVTSKGYFYIVDRLKELIKVKGNQVAPAELEALLLEHPQLSDAAVVGVTIDGEELPRAYVVPREDAKGKVQEEEVAEWLAKRVNRFKRLAGGVMVVDSIPKNPSGKILRRFLRERAKEEVGVKKAKL